MNDTGNPEQIGELVYQVIPSAYLQAVSQALGTQLDCLPLKYDDVYRHIKELKSRNAATEIVTPAAEEPVNAEENKDADSTEAQR